jgi:CDP-6-deoxy-D-xylo-4-hexulose-3-dehydrase
MNNIKWPLMKNAITLSDRLHLSYFLLTSDRYTNGPKVREFEAKWAEWVGSKYALMVSSGSTANYLLLAAVKEKYGLKNGDKVLVPACTWVTNISPVMQLGLKPIFCDVNLVNYSFDLDHMTQIKQKHPDIKMIFVTHLLGYSAENEAYQSLFPDAIILDDVCESHGCRGPNGTRRGGEGLGGTFSFYFGHHMTTVEGGMVNTNDQDLYELMRMKRSHGLARESGNLKKYADQYPDIHPQFLFMTDGYNFRSSDINAVIGLRQLPRLDSMVEHRKENFLRFTEIIAQHYDKFHPVIYQEGNSNFAFPFICRTPQIAANMKAAFDKNGVEHRPIVGGNLLRQPFLKGHKFGVPRKDSNVDLLNDNGVYIGNSHFVARSDVEWLDLIMREINA